MVILAAIDERRRSVETLRIAHDLASTYGDMLVALHVVPSESFEAHKHSLEEIPHLRDFSLSQEKESAKRFVQQLVDETLGQVETEIEPRGAVGDAATEVLDHAAALEPRYLVIGGRRRSLTGKVLFGSTAQTILLNADCPVVSMIGKKRDG